MLGVVEPGLEPGNQDGTLLFSPRGVVHGTGTCSAARPGNLRVELTRERHDSFNRFFFVSLRPRILGEI